MPWNRAAWRLLTVCALAFTIGTLLIGIRSGNVAQKELPMSLGTPALAAAPTALPRPLSALLGRSSWLNTPPLRPEDLRGKVVLVNFWTYSCINSLRPLPYLRAWANRYGKEGLVVIGVHTPEFGFEHDISRVREALVDHGLHYPVVLDNDFGIWRRFGNDAWPGFYFIGADGRLRGSKLGEGDYAQSEALIRKLLAEAGAGPEGGPVTPVLGKGIEAAPDWADLRTPETYVGYDKARGFSSPGGLRPDRSNPYDLPATILLNHWALGGRWTVGREYAAPEDPAGKIRLRFHARDLHLVMGLAPGAAPIQFRITLDGAAPGPDAGTDVQPDGSGTVKESRLYQLVRQNGHVTDRDFEIELEDPGAQIFSFTFG